MRYMEKQCKRYENIKEMHLSTSYEGSEKKPKQPPNYISFEEYTGG